MLKMFGVVWDYVYFCISKYKYVYAQGRICEYCGQPKRWKIDTDESISGRANKHCHV